MVTIRNYFLFICILVLHATAANASYLEYNANNSDLRYVHFGFYNKGTQAHAGKIDISLEGFSSTAFCIELGTSIGSDEITTENPADYWETINLGNNVYYAAWLMDQYNPAFGYSATGYSTFESYLALQFAIWDTIYDLSVDSDTGNYFYLTGDNENFVSGVDNWSNYKDWMNQYEINAWELASTYTQSLETALNDDTFSFAGKYSIFVADFDSANNTHGLGAQELLVSQVPEPSTILLFGMGLLFAGAASRRKS